MVLFDGKGDIIATGRKVKDNKALPLLTSEALQRQQTRLEKKFGRLTVAHTYEMIAKETTRYFSTLDNSKVTIVISASPNGHCIVERKERKAPVDEIRPPQNVIAKKN